ncbi:MAG: hypothetical protein ABSG32_05315 [Terriglobia bacterium]
MYITLVCCCFLFNAGGAVYLLAQAKLERRNKIQFAVAALISIALKLVLASRWSDYDLGSYGNVASLVLHGKSVYANTEYYNYAPLWSFFLAGLKQISTLLPTMRGQAFHFSIAAFLAVVDVALAALLAAKYRYGAGIFFLCCPVTVLLTGSYSQFDNFALLAGLAAWLLVREGAAAWRRVLPSAGLLGLSLVIKHVFFLFPLWLLFWPKLGSLRKRMAYLAIAYGLFVVSFLPWAADPLSRAGIYQHVFLYRSRFYFSVYHLVAASRHFWMVSPTETKLLTLIWMAVLMAAGIKVGRGESDLFPMYLLVMFAFSPAVNDYYFALPMLACAILYPSWPMWALTSTAIVVLYASPGGVFDFPFSRVYYLAMLSSQISAGALFIVQQKQAARPDSVALTAQNTARKALTLAVGGMATIFLLLLIKAWTLGMVSSTWLLPADNG